MWLVVACDSRRRGSVERDGGFGGAGAMAGEAEDRSPEAAERDGPGNRSPVQIFAALRTWKDHF